MGGAKRRLIRSIMRTFKKKPEHLHRALSKEDAKRNAMDRGRTDTILGETVRVNEEGFRITEKIPEGIKRFIQDNQSSLPANQEEKGSGAKQDGSKIPPVD